MNIFLNSVGCRLNQSEIERISNQFRMLGHQIVGKEEECDVVILNTCTVTSAAASDSRSLARQAYRKNPSAKIVLTGCWSTLEEDHALRLPGVIKVIPNKDKDKLVSIFLNHPQENIDFAPTPRIPIPGVRSRTRAFIKAQDGCDNRCTYCVTTLARGPARSIPEEQIINEIQSARNGGAQEAVLTGVQLTAYGKDLAGSDNLEKLIKSILKNTEIPRLRLSSLEPWQIRKDLFDLWENARLCRQLHLPLQSGSETTLRRMGRPISPQRYASLLAQARDKIPGIAITTDIIVGFPGETEEEFQETLDFVTEMHFAHGHVFIYSPRPGTSAFLLPDRVPNQIARLRSKLIRDVLEQSAGDYIQSHLGKELVALWETAISNNQNQWEMKGLTDNYLRVHSMNEQNLWNKLTPVRILTYKNHKINAEILP